MVFICYRGKATNTTHKGLKSEYSYISSQIALISLDMGALDLSVYFMSYSYSMLH